jgi:pyruvate kinase
MARINMSHGTHETHARNIELVREASARRLRPIAVLADLAGPKIRVGDLHQPLDLVADAVVFAPKDGATCGGEIPTTYADLAHGPAARQPRPARRRADRARGEPLPRATGPSSR